MSQLVTAQLAAPQRTRVAPLVRGEDEAGGVARSAVRDFEHLLELCGGVPYAFPTAANRVAAVVSRSRRRRRRLRCRGRRSCCRQQCLRLAELGSLSCSSLPRLTSSPLLFVAAPGAGSAEPIRRCRRRRSSTPAARGPWRTARWCRLHASSSPPRGAGRAARARSRCTARAQVWARTPTRCCSSSGASLSARSCSWAPRTRTCCAAARRGRTGASCSTAAAARTSRPRCPCATT